MRTIWCLLAALAVLAAVGIAGLAIVIPRIAESDAVRESIERASADALGRPLAYERLRAGLLPPRIELVSPRLPGAEPDDSPLLVADRVAMRIAIAPLLALAVVIDSLEIHGLAVTLVRTEDGIAWPAPAARDEPTAAAPEREEEDGGPPLSIAVRRVAVHDARLAWLDRTVTPPMSLELESIELRAHARHPAEPIDIRGEAALASGGRLSLEGSATLDGSVDGRVRLDELEVDPAWIPSEPPPTGRLTASGDVDVAGPVTAPERLHGRISLHAHELSLGDVVVDGPVDLEVSRVAGAAAAYDFSIEATRSRIAPGPRIVKPPGTPASARGRVDLAPSGDVAVRFDRVVLGEMTGTGSVRLGEATVFVLDAEPFALEGLRALVAPDTELPVAGRMSVEGLRVGLQPASVEGQVALDAVRIGLPAGGAIELEGRLVGRGDAVDLSGFEVRIGGQPLAVTGRVRDPLGERAFAIRLVSRGVLSADALLAGFEPSLAGTLSGPLQVEGSISGVPGEAMDVATLLGSLDGRVAIDIGRQVGDGGEGGRLVGFSTLAEVLRGLEALGTLARLGRGLPGGRVPDLDAYASDRFDRLEAHFTVHDGLLESEQLRVEYPQYGLGLQGTVRLVDLSLDMRGEMEIRPGLAATLGARSPEGGLVVPIARIGGTLSEPDVTVSKAALGALAVQILPLAPGLESVTDEIEKVVPGAGRIFRERLGEILNGGGDKK